MLYFTSDLHFGNDRALWLQSRPFKSYSEFESVAISNINNSVTPSDTIYCLGDWVDCNRKGGSKWEHAIGLVSKVNCTCKLILGNNEQNLIDRKFDGNLKEFSNYCYNAGWKGVYKSSYIKINNIKVCLVHNPMDRDVNMLNLYGHIHRYSIYSSFGLNVGCDVHHFLPLSELDVRKHLLQMKMYYRKQPWMQIIGKPAIHSYLWDSLK